MAVLLSVTPRFAFTSLDGITFNSVEECRAAMEIEAASRKSEISDLLRRRRVCSPRAIARFTRQAHNAISSVRYLRTLWNDTKKMQEIAKSIQNQIECDRIISASCLDI